MNRDSEETKHNTPDLPGANEKTIYDVFRTPKPHQGWLRNFPMLASFADRSEVEDAILDDRKIPRLDGDFWQTRTEAIEAAALRHMSDLNIDGIFYEVAFIMDENLPRFDRMVAYFGDFYPDGDPSGFRLNKTLPNA